MISEPVIVGTTEMNLKEGFESKVQIQWTRISSASHEQGRMAQESLQ